MSFNPIDLWNTMTPLAKGVALLLVIMSIYSLTVAVERFIYYAKAKKQSLQFAVLVTGFLKKDQIQEAIDSSKRFKNSHLARVVSAGLYEFQHDITTGTADVPGHDPIEAAERAIEREALITTADMKKGLSGLATIGTTAPFIGLFGTVIGIIKSFHQMAVMGTGGFAVVAAGISEALVATALGLIVAIIAVMFFNYMQVKIANLDTLLRVGLGKVLEAADLGGVHGAK